MRVPVILLVVSLAWVGVALTLPGWSDVILVAGPAALACVILLVQALRARPVSPVRPNYILVDGSNVMHWKGGTPQINTLREVIINLTERGFTPGVVFDANAGYLISGKYQHDHTLGRTLGLPADRVIVVNRGEPADPTLLAAARDLGAKIVTNDRYRDWADTHPEVQTPGFLIRGGYRDNCLWLDLDAKT